MPRWTRSLSSRKDGTVPAKLISGLRRSLWDKWDLQTENDECDSISLSLEKAAKSRYRQLYKKTQRTWKMIRKAFLNYYCSQYDQSARSGYYSAKRQESEDVCDFLFRMNVFARAAQTHYEKGWAESEDYVENFLLTVDMIAREISYTRNDWVIYIEWNTSSVIRCQAKIARSNESEWTAIDYLILTDMSFRSVTAETAVMIIRVHRGWTW